MHIKHGKVQFSKRDVWNLDNVLSDVIHGALVKFKNTERSGYPASLSTEEGNDASQEWEEILNKMIFAFDESREPDILDYDFTFNWINLDGKVDNDLESGVRYTIEATNKDEHQRYKQDEQKWKSCCDEGRMLFAKYFNSLWD